MKEVIAAENMTKIFYTYEKLPGLLGSVKSLFIRKKIEIKALNDVSFSVNKGDVVGLLGANGAGKTTVIKLLTGILHLTSGQLSVLGKDPFKKENDFLKRISLVTGSKGQLFWDLNALDNFILLKKIYEVDDAHFKKFVSEMSERLNVSSLLNTQIRRLSLGERMKMEIIASLLHFPELIFLDEPTIGLDVSSQDELRKFLYEHWRNTGCTIILTSHNLADISAVCNRILLINKGSLYYNGTLSEFCSTYGGYKQLVIEFKNDINESDAGSIRSHLPDCDIEVDKNRISVKVNNENATWITQKMLNDFYGMISDIKIEEPKAEDLMKDILFGRSFVDEAGRNIAI